MIVRRPTIHFELLRHEEGLDVRNGVEAVMHSILGICCAVRILQRCGEWWRWRGNRTVLLEE